MPTYDMVPLGPRKGWDVVTVGVRGRVLYHSSCFAKAMGVLEYLKQRQREQTQITRMRWQRARKLAMRSKSAA